MMIIIISAAIIIGAAYGMNKGYKQAMATETACTLTVPATLVYNKTHHFLTADYYTVTANYEHNGKQYSSRRGLFGTENKNIASMDIHINPDNPEECYFINRRFKTPSSKRSEGGGCQRQNHTKIP